MAKSVTNEDKATAAVWGSPVPGKIRVVFTAAEIAAYEIKKAAWLANQSV